MNETIQAYPLSWPQGWKRHVSRSHAKFMVDKRAPTIRDGVHRVMQELGRLYVREETVVISTNIRPSLTGGQGSNATDPGVAVYWTRRGDKRCMAIDNYFTVAGNLCAIAATLEAMRAIERHGGAAILDRAFTGFTAIAAPEQSFQVLGVAANATREQIDQAYRRLISDAHPDREGGSHDLAARLNAARDDLLARLGS